MFIKTMSTTQEFCGICSKEPFKYTCPKCNLLYCSLNCYKAAVHLKCSEEFYKSCIQDQLHITDKNDANEMHKMVELLERLRKADEGLPLDEPLDESIDSDDDSCDDDEIEEKDIGERLKGIDLNDSTAVWERLTEAERNEFLQLTNSGDIMKLIPQYKAWWEVKDSKIVDLTTAAEHAKKHSPAILPNIPNFSSICQKAPSSSVEYNLWNIISAYACVVRFFQGEHQLHAFDAVSHLFNLSSALKYGTHFEQIEDAITSVKMEALTTPDSSNFSNISIVGDHEQVKQDAQYLMSKVSFKLAALSDISRLLQKAKQELKLAKGTTANYQKLVSLSRGCDILSTKSLQVAVKKFEFLLSYVNRETVATL